MRATRAKQTPSERYAEWMRYLEAAYAEIVEAFWHRRIYRAVREMFLKNPRLHTPAGGAIWAWIRDMYGRDAVMLVRRELDTQNAALNLLRMLYDMEKHSDVLADLAKGSVVPTQVEIRADRRRLEKQARKVLDFGHRRLAHRTPRASPTLNDLELDEGLRTIRLVMLKYYGVLRGADLADATPVANYDWLAPFRVPWLPAEGFEEPDLEEAANLSAEEKAANRARRRMWGF